MVESYETNLEGIYLKEVWIFQIPKEKPQLQKNGIIPLYQNYDKPSLQGRLDGRYSTNLAEWETSMTDPRLHGETFRYLVHTVSDDHGVVRAIQMGLLLESVIAGEKININSINLLQDPEKIVEKPLISTSLIDETHRSTWTPGGYILIAPLDNILRTASQDLGTPFYRGDEEVKKLYAERDLEGIANPDLVLAKTTSGYNEIVLTGTGRTGKKVQIQGVFATIFPDGQYVDASLATRLSYLAESRDLPFVRIMQSFYPYEDRDPQIGQEEEWFAVNDAGVRYLFEPAKQKFQVLEYGGLKEQSMSPQQRRLALTKAKFFLQSSPHETLKALVEAAEAVPDDVLSE